MTCNSVIDKISSLNELHNKNISLLDKTNREKDTLLLLYNYIEKDKQDEYLTNLLELHNKNVEYEQLNPPIWYGGDKAKRKFEKEHKVKAPREKKPKAKGPSAAERKLAAKVAKINALSFKIKPQN